MDSIIERLPQAQESFPFPLCVDHCLEGTVPQFS